MATTPVVSPPTVGFQINGTAGDDTFYGSDLDDLIYGLDGNDTIFGGGGNDRIEGGAGADNLYGGAGDDTLVGGAGGDLLSGGDGNDFLYGGDGYDRLYGGNGNDVLDGGAGQDDMWGGLGNDTYYVDTPWDSVENTGERVFENAGEGIDTVFSSVDFALPDNVERLTLTGTARWGWGNELNNAITGTESTNNLLGGAGNDTLNGNGGADILFGGSGNDTLNGGNGNDDLYGDDDDPAHTGNDILNGGSGSDKLYGGNGNDTLNGGAGADVMMGSSGEDIFVFDSADFTQGTAAGSIYHGGSPFNTYYGISDDDTIKFTGGQTLNLTTLADDKILSIEILDLTAGNNTVVLSATDIVAMMDASDRAPDLRVWGNADDTVTLAGPGWAHILSNAVIDGHSCDYYGNELVGVVGVGIWIENAIVETIS